MLNELVFWHWWIFAALLLVAELLLPTTFLLWPGLAAAAVGLLTWLVPGVRWEAQLLIFGVLSVTAIVLSRMYLKRRPISTDQPRLNRRGQQYVDRVFTLEEPIINGVGRLRVDDTTWRIVGKDTPAGQRVKVIGVSGTSLQVESRSND